MVLFVFICVFFFFKQKTAYEIGWCDWSSVVCSSDLKPDADLRYLHKDATRGVELVAAGPDGKWLGVRNLRLARIRLSYVSVLARQFDGTYKYQSVKKEVPVSDAP